MVNGRGDALGESDGDADDFGDNSDMEDDGQTLQGKQFVNKCKSTIQIS